MGATDGQILAGLEQQLALHGRTIAWTVPDAAAVEVTALVGPTRTEERETPRGREAEQTRTVRMRRTDLEAAGWPSLDGAFTIDGASWSVRGVEHETPVFVALRLVDLEAMSRTRDRYVG